MYVCACMFAFSFFITSYLCHLWLGMAFPSFSLCWTVFTHPWIFTSLKGDFPATLVGSGHCYILLGLPTTSSCLCAMLWKSAADCWASHHLNYCLSGKKCLSELSSSKITIVGGIYGNAWGKLCVGGVKREIGLGKEKMALLSFPPKDNFYRLFCSLPPLCRWRWQCCCCRVWAWLWWPRNWLQPTGGHTHMAEHLRSCVGIVGSDGVWSQVYILARQVILLLQTHGRFYFWAKIKQKAELV